MVTRLTKAQREMMERLPFEVYSPSSGGGKDWAELIKLGLVRVDDIGGSQETVLQVSATPAGRAALQEPSHAE